MRRSKWGKYLEDWRTFPNDAALGYRNEGLRGVWKALATRSLHYVFRSGHLLVFAQSLVDDIPNSTISGVVIRPADGGDWGALGALVGQRDLRRFREMATKGGHFLVAWRGQQPIGYASVAEAVGPDVTIWPLPLNVPATAAYLWNLYVLPSERGSGVGSALAQARLRTARERGFREGWRMVAPMNRASLRTVEKTGRGTRLVGQVHFFQLFNQTYASFNAEPVD
jgi:GNAT superfamily N-acetyltransferase